jgi:curved DNA-binding protein
MVDPRSELPNYYGILGVTSSATPQEIDQAYRRLASRYHPDVSHGATGATEKFKSIAEAYEILADPSRRRDYDASQRKRRRSVGRPAPTVGSLGPGVSPRLGPELASDFLDSFSGLAPWGELASGYRVSPRRPAAARSNLDVEADLPLTPEEASRGGPCEFTLTLPRVCSVCEGRARAANAVCSTCGGTGQVAGPRTSIQVVLPPGVGDGVVLRVPGRGRGAAGSGGRGDLYLTVRVRPCW